MYEQMLKEEIQPDHVTYFTLIQGCLLQKKHDYAIDLFLQVIKSSSKNANNFGKASYSQKIEFTSQQQAFLYSILKRMVIDENNEVAVKRYGDVNTILTYFKAFHEL